MTTAGIYLDFNASTPIAPEVQTAMAPFVSGHFGNPSADHWAARAARDALAQARAQVAELLGAQPEEVVFTSGGTEANNHALKGVYFSRRHRGGHIITTAVEHPAIHEPCRFLASLGARVTTLPVDRFGRVHPEQVAEAITDETILVSVMLANNEVGTLQPLADIARITKARGVLLHTDAAQAAGKIPIDVQTLGVDLLSVAGHKMYAPKGVGALYIRNGLQLEPFMHGAGHEAGRRAGTENVLLNVALGAAAALVRQELPRQSRLAALRDHFWLELQTLFGDQVVLNGHPSERLPNTLNVSFRDVPGADILAAMPTVAASTGSACHTGSVELSPVLQAMGISPEVGMGAIRFSLGRTTTPEDIERVLAMLAKHPLLMR